MDHPLGERIDADTIGGIVLASGQAAVDYNFCEHVPSSIGGAVFHDRNNNGLRDEGEEGIANVLLELRDAEGATVAISVTDAAGAYEFTQVVAGTYSIVETQPVDWVDGIDTVGTFGGASRGTATNPGDTLRDIEIRWGESGRDYHFGELRWASIRGRVQTSTVDGDCFGDEEDHAPIAGATVELLDARGQVLEETTTDANGEYAFTNLLPGTYSVRQSTPEGLIDGGAQPGRVDDQTRGAAAGPSRIDDMRLTSGEALTDARFCEHVPSTLSGQVYYDEDLSGDWTLGESGLAGVTVELYTLDGQRVDSVRTNEDGSYAFTNLPADAYRIVERQPTGFLDGNETVGTVDGVVVGTLVEGGDAITDVVLGWGVTALDYDFGEWRSSSISGRVHSEIELDCFFDPSIGEQGLGGVTIELTDVQGVVVASTVTNADGTYTFQDVAPGVYHLREGAVEGYFDGGQVTGSAGGDASQPNEIRSISVGSGAILTGYHFCETTPAEVSGYVFVDGPPVTLIEGESLPERIADVRDGVRSDDDRMLAGVVLELRDGITGEVVQASERTLPGVYPEGPVTTVTSADGSYVFPGLRPGQYAIYQRQPVEDLVDGVDTPGTASGVVFNPGEAQNEQVLAALSVDPQNDGIVRIGLAPGIAATDYNFSEVEVEIEAAPVDPPTQRFPFTPPLTPTPPPQTPTLGPDAQPAAASPGIAGYRVQPAGAIGGIGRAPAWHLSIINGGHPRGNGAATAGPDSVWLTAEDSPRRRADLTQASWQFTRGYGPQSAPIVSSSFGLAGGIAIAGDFNGDGYDEIGVYVGGEWFIDLNGNGQWDAADLWARLGTHNDLPVTGDWDGDGKWDIGIFGKEWGGDAAALAHEPGLPDVENRLEAEPKNVPPGKSHATNRARLLRPAHQRQVRADIVDHVFRFGGPTDFPIAGDWNGDGITSIGVFREGIWYLDVDGNGRPSMKDLEVSFGAAGDQPIVGDWNGDGVDDLAIYRDGVLIMDSNGNGRVDDSDRRLTIGQPGDQLVAGDFDGDGVDEVAVYRAAAG